MLWLVPTSNPQGAKVPFSFASLRTKVGYARKRRSQYCCARYEVTGKRQILDFNNRTQALRICANTHTKLLHYIRRTLQFE